MDAFDSELDYGKVRMTYLVTYSQANLETFPTRESFGKAVVEAFSQKDTKVKVAHWVCSMEEHEDDAKHYHVAIKFTGNKRWKGAKIYLLQTYRASVHFSNRHDNYYTAYSYAVKSDEEAYHSHNHPDLGRSPKTKQPSMARRRSSTGKVAGRTTSAIGIKRRMSNIEISHILVKNKIKRDTELLALANEQKGEGKTDLAAWVLSHTSKARGEIISATWGMEEASIKLARQRTERMSLIHKAMETACPESCEGLWLTSAKELLRKNSIHPYVFADAVRTLLEKGRGKYRNILIIGPANCGKTFILEPLSKIFSTFSNPATTSYAWIGVEHAEIILMNDFRWSNELIVWKDLLLLFEGQTVHFPAPKSQYLKDICLENDTPVFATSKGEIEYIGKYNSRDERETEMMQARWRIFHFTNQIPKEEQKEIVPCTRCFSELVLLGIEA